MEDIVKVQSTEGEGFLEVYNEIEAIITSSPTDASMALMVKTSEHLCNLVTPVASSLLQGMKMSHSTVLDTMFVWIVYFEDIDLIVVSADSALMTMIS